MHTDFCVSLHAAATDACVRRDSPLTCRLAAWWCSRTPGSAEKTRWLQSAASRLPWGPDLGWLTPGCVGKQTHTQKKGWVNKQTMPAGGNTRPRRQRFEQLSSLCQRHRQGDMIYWPLGTRTCQWLLFMEIPPCRAPPCLRLLFLKAHNSVACLFFFFPDVEDWDFAASCTCVAAFTVYSTRTQKENAIFFLTLNTFHKYKVRDGETQAETYKAKCSS